MNIVKTFLCKWETRQDEIAYQRHKKQWDAEKIKWKPYFELRAKHDADNYARKLEESKMQKGLAQAVMQTFLVHEHYGLYRCVHCGEQYLAVEGQESKDVMLELAHEENCVVVDAVRTLAEEFAKRESINEHDQNPLA